MINSIKHVRGAVGLLNPEEVRRRARQPIDIVLVAPSNEAYRAMEEFLAPADGARVFRADPRRPAPKEFDLVLYHAGLAVPPGAFRLRAERPRAGRGRHSRREG